MACDASPATACSVRPDSLHSGRNVSYCARYTRSTSPCAGPHPKCFRDTETESPASGDASRLTDSTKPRPSRRKLKSPARMRFARVGATPLCSERYAISSASAPCRRCAYCPPPSCSPDAIVTVLSSSWYRCSATRSVATPSISNPYASHPLRAPPASWNFLLKKCPAAMHGRRRRRTAVAPASGPPSSSACSAASPAPPSCSTHSYAPDARFSHCTRPPATARCESATYAPTAVKSFVRRPRSQSSHSTPLTQARSAKAEPSTASMPSHQPSEYALPPISCRCSATTSTPAAMRCTSCAHRRRTSPVLSSPALPMFAVITLHVNNPSFSSPSPLAATFKRGSDTTRGFFSFRSDRNGDVAASSGSGESPVSLLFIYRGGPRLHNPPTHTTPHHTT
eukprot:Rhum_TRINITY_DN14292_c4_g1::Rhum_TRINITY_DN14292_c4_g1_i1::g.78132::m.78132